MKRVRVGLESCVECIYLYISKWQEVPGIYAYDRKGGQCLSGCSYVPSRKQRRRCCKSKDISVSMLSYHKHEHSTHIRISKAACFLSCFGPRRYAWRTSGRAVWMFFRPRSLCIAGLVEYMGSRTTRLQAPSRRRSNPMMVMEWPGC
jgi:hypothetical protein